jgi:4-hydroxy-tetrahydrodipicolinate synthase
MAAMMPLMNFLDEGKFVQKIKHGCELAGLKAGAPRLPLLPLDAGEERQLATLVAALTRDVAAIISKRAAEEPVR